MATCLYKAKPCDICGHVIQVGEECDYIAETKGVRHYGCEPAEQPPSPEQFALADRLGFLPHDEAMRASWKFKVTEDVYECSRENESP